MDVCTNDDGGYLKTDSSIDEFTFRYYFLGETNNGCQCAKIDQTTPYPGSSEGTYPNSPTAYYGCCPSGVSCSAAWLRDCSQASSTVSGYTYTAASAKYPTGLAWNEQACTTGSKTSTGTLTCSSSGSSGGTSGGTSSTSDMDSDSGTTQIPFINVVMASIAALASFRFFF